MALAVTSSAVMARYEATAPQSVMAVNRMPEFSDALIRDDPARSSAWPGGGAAAAQTTVTTMAIGDDSLALDIAPNHSSEMTVMTN
jgi:hypothetical protein